jgi:hypothetical protein
VLMPLRFGTHHHFWSPYKGFLDFINFHHFNRFSLSCWYQNLSLWFIFSLVLFVLIHQSTFKEFLLKLLHQKFITESTYYILYVSLVFLLLLIVLVTLSKSYQTLSKFITLHIFDHLFWNSSLQTF